MIQVLTNIVPPLTAKTSCQVYPAASDKILPPKTGSNVPKLGEKYISIHQFSPSWSPLKKGCQDLKGLHW